MKSQTKTIYYSCSILVCIFLLIIHTLFQIESTSDEYTINRFDLRNEFSPDRGSLYPRKMDRSLQTKGEVFAASVLARATIGNPLVASGKVEHFILEYKRQQLRPTVGPPKDTSVKIEEVTQAYSTLLAAKTHYGHPDAIKLLDERINFLRTELIRLVDSQ